MELANDLMAGLRGRVLPGGKSAANPGLDWPGLHARLCAAHAARAEIESLETRRWPPAGGFACWARSVHPAAKPSQRVNLTDSTDGKATSGIAVDIAEQLAVGD